MNDNDDSNWPFIQLKLIGNLLLLFEWFMRKNKCGLMQYLQEENSMEM